MQMLNRTGPIIDPWDTLLVTGMQLDLVPLITPLRAPVQTVFNPPHHLLIQPIHQQVLYEDLMGDSVKGPTVVQVDNSHCSPLICQASHFIIEIYQVGQARLPIGEAMLTTSTPDDLLVLNAPENGFQD